MSAIVVKLKVPTCILVLRSPLATLAPIPVPRVVQEGPTCGPVLIVHEHNIKNDQCLKFMLKAAAVELVPATCGALRVMQEGQNCGLGITLSLP